MAIRFAYRGDLFPSYARDPGQPGSVEELLLKCCQKEGADISSYRAGSRTDRGVSATFNVCRISFARPTLDGLLPALQSRAPKGLQFVGYAVVDDQWNPRRAKWRRYTYTCSPALDFAATKNATRQFLGRHNMQAFARVEEGQNPERTILDFQVHEGNLWQFTVTGHAFLWNQVRRMVGACIAVGNGKATIDELQDALRTGQINPLFQSAPARGLMLEHIEYDLQWHRYSPRGRNWQEMKIQNAVNRQWLDELTRSP